MILSQRPLKTEGEGGEERRERREVPMYKLHEGTEALVEERPGESELLMEEKRNAWQAVP